ncbi:glutamate carboxypeptidase [Polynucleobacter wuianus]|uniref:Glutamate carboxypeptidase n=1 Tax=Polynucleobacter wuianus TaxID=1743168 RepID=A0A191UFY9_9BURK|nr:MULTISPECIES: glutamate carboxypeptidase [Polynucleobacter]ANI99934.1 glutamate carboxypeptidase [Polynucleobacter wuianus]MBU3552761.1 M20/M25/M40 family metallo-hydrolase [Polynucleobacter sp. MWH-Post4-6-1]
MKKLLFVFCAVLGNCVIAVAAPQEPVFSVVQKEQGPYLATLKELVSIESGSRNREGLDRISQLIFNKLKSLGGQVEFIEPGMSMYRMHDTPDNPGRMVKAEFKGSGKKKILLIAHMDTVYLKGMLAKQPFRIDGDRAYGLGISDDKQGIALILHTIESLKKLKVNDYGKVTVLINGDEEISSPAARAYFSKLGAEHDVTFSCEASQAKSDRIALTTAGIAAVNLNITGKASHAGSAPELGRNALDELSYQIQQMRNLSDAKEGIKMNWTLATAGTNRNVIPASAFATADVRVMKKDDFDVVEREVRERVKTQQTPDVKVDIGFERRRPPLVTSPQSLQMAEYAKKVYAELGRDLVLGTVATGGGTDAAFAALDTQNPVIESMGVQGFGAHSNDDEYILVSSITPRMYLLSRLIIDISNGKVGSGN